MRTSKLSASCHRPTGPEPLPVGDRRVDPRLPPDHLTPGRGGPPGRAGRRRDRTRGADRQVDTGSTSRSWPTQLEAGPRSRRDRASSRSGRASVPLSSSNRRRGSTTGDSDSSPGVVAHLAVRHPHPEGGPPPGHRARRTGALAPIGAPARSLSLHRRRVPLQARGRGPGPHVRRRGRPVPHQPTVPPPGRGSAGHPALHRLRLGDPVRIRS